MQQAERKILVNGGLGAIGDERRMWKERQEAGEIWPEQGVFTDTDFLLYERLTLLYERLRAVRVQRMMRREKLDRWKAREGGGGARKEEGEGQGGFGGLRGCRDMYEAGLVFLLNVYL